MSSSSRSSWAIQGRRKGADLLAGGGVGEVTEVLVHRLAGRRGIRGELVAEVFEGEFEALLEQDGVGQGGWQVVKERLHDARGFQVALGVALEQPAGGIEAWCGGAGR